MVTQLLKHLGLTRPQLPAATGRPTRYATPRVMAPKTCARATGAAVEHVNQRIYCSR